MNEAKRKSLRKAAEHLSSARVLVETVCDQEQDAMERYPENLQGTERFEKMEDAVDALEEAGEKIESAHARLQEVIETIQGAQERLTSAMN